MAHPYTRAACAAGVVTKNTDRNSLRYSCTYNGIRKVRQLALGCESNWVKSTHDAYENTWKCGELKLYFSPSAGGWKKKKLDYRMVEYYYKKWKYTPAVRSKISSKPILASCVWYPDRAHYELCVLIKDIGRRLPLQLQCSYQGQQGDFSQSVRWNYKTRFWGGILLWSQFIRGSVH